LAFSNFFRSSSDIIPIGFSLLTSNTFRWVSQSVALFCHLLMCTPANLSGLSASANKP
jgi:hypothetical protein